MKNIIGIDTSKNFFHAVCINNLGQTIWKKKYKRADFKNAFVQIPESLIGMESCSGSQHWARELLSLGHQVKLLHPRYVKAFVKTNKNDFNDAQAIAEASVRENIRTVPVKSTQQQELQAVHRMRTRLVRDRTAIINEARGFLTEFGIVFPVTKEKFLKAIALLFASNTLQATPLLEKLLKQSMQQFHELEEKISWCEGLLKEFSKSNEPCQRIQKVEGVGLITSTAMLASVADFESFKDARSFAAWLGLTPKQFSTGGKTILGGISKRGHVYIRTLLIQGAHAAIRFCKDKQDAKSLWIKALLAKKGRNLTAVAVANKTARIIWAMLKNNTEYKLRLAA
jgi:transposase